MATTLLIATTNAGKARELAGGLTAFFAGVVTLDAYPDVEPMPETGRTFQENAEAKALYYADRTGLVCLADDSGLEVDALGGRPGVHSARYGGEDATDEARVTKLLDELESVPPGRRKARFVCHLALARPGRLLVSMRGDVAGRIAAAPRGRNGFGYDPVFVPEGCRRTMAQIRPEEKNRISHRAAALAGLRRALARDPEP